MSILVRSPGAGLWEEWTGNATVNQIVSSYNASYADGRVVEMPCDPYPVAVNINGNQVRNLYDQGIWSLQEVTNVGGKIAVPFEVPEGKQAVGAPTYAEQEDGSVLQVYAIEDIPQPPPPMTAEEKFARFLSDYGLTKEELRGMIA